MTIDLRFQPFITYASSKIAGSQQRQRAVSMALGVAVARFLPALPPGSAGTTHHYDTSMFFQASEIISRFNESFLVDVEVAKDVCRSFWLMRQSVISADNNSPILANGNGTFIERAFGMNTQASPEVIHYLNSNPAVMSTLVNRISLLLVPEQLGE